MAEWESMLAREKKFGFKTPENPKGLIYPVKFFDGNLFPEKAKRTQYIDLEEWNNPYPQFKNTNRYDRFIKKMQEVAQEMASLISSAPRWQKDFPIVVPQELQEPKGLSELPRLK